MREKFLAQEHNTMAPTSARTRTARSGDMSINHEATAPPTFQLEQFHDKRSKMTIITANHTQGDGVKDQSKLWECAGKVTWNKCEGKAH